MLLIKGILIFIVGISGTAFTIVWIIKAIMKFMDDSFIISNYNQEDDLNNTYAAQIPSNITDEHTNSTVLLDDSNHNP